jgi:epoxyqueuosine reductase
VKAELTNLLKSQARELGFQKVGIAPAEPIAEAQRRLAQWLHAGRHATMSWLARRQVERGDIRVYFPEVRSVVVVGMNYFTGRSGDVVAGGCKTVHFSNYAWGRDYHNVLKERLSRLLVWIHERDPDVQGLVCVDTAPVMEKVWAQRAGLGWQGKHTNLISRDYGSWLFLGELLLNVELEYDPPFAEDLCGRCTACLEACPTQALEPYRIDAGKCISYLTIEHRGELPPAYREQLHGWIFGCDVCQEVCPWNRKFEQPTAEEAFQPKPEIREWSLADWQALEGNQFRQLFRDSAVRRTKYHGLMRNIAAVSGSPDHQGSGNRPGFSRNRSLRLSGERR